MFAVFSEVAELDRNVIMERVRADLRHARAKGRSWDVAKNQSTWLNESHFSWAWREAFPEGGRVRANQDRRHPKAFPPSEIADVPKPYHLSVPPSGRGRSSRRHNWGRARSFAGH